MTDCLSHHVLAFLGLAVRSKKANQAFSSKFLNQTFAVYKEPFFFFFLNENLSLFPVYPKSYFQIQWELKEMKNSAEPQRVTPVEYRNRCEIFFSLTNARLHRELTISKVYNRRGLLTQDKLSLSYLNL